MSRCAECTTNVCTKCDANGILRNDRAGCVTVCTEDTSSGLGDTKVPSYEAANPELRYCVSNCS